MGRHHWDIEKMTVGDTCFAMSTQDGYVGALSRDNAESIKASHNADCDVYEARIAQLEAENGSLQNELAEYGDTPEDKSALRQQIDWLENELAHVKAESLRVVPVGEACELQDCVMEYCFIEGKTRLNVASEFAKQHYPTMRVQPVRLERWEDEG